MRVQRLLYDEAGFSLLEMVLVIALLSILFLLIAPPISRLYQHAELDSAARGVEVEIRGQQMAAFSHQDAHELWFSKFTPKYTIGEQGVYQQTVKLPARVAYKNGYLEPAVSDLRFDPTGSVLGSGSLHFVSTAKEAADVSVTVGTGFVQYDGVYRR